MKKKYKILNVDCANCAAKMEDSIKKIEGVEDASLSFMLQKLSITMPDDQADRILAEARKVCKKIDSAVEIQA